jgi:hypothetical protein
LGIAARISGNTASASDNPAKTSTIAARISDNAAKTTDKITKPPLIEEVLIHFSYRGSNDESCFNCPRGLIKKPPKLLHVGGFFG